MATKRPKERSFPKLEFTDSEAGALDFPSSKSRATPTSSRPSCAPPCTRTSRSTCSPTRTGI